MKLIDRVVDAFGIPAEEWRTEETRKYDLFIEAQVWASISSSLVTADDFNTLA